MKGHQKPVNKQIKSSKRSYPFLFLGAGEASYFEFFKLIVVFKKLSLQNFKKIKNLTPKELSAGLMQNKNFISVFVGDEGYNKNSFLHKKKFNKKLDEWLIKVNNVCPIEICVRGVDSESSGTKLSMWHKHSLKIFKKDTKRFTELFEKLNDKALKKDLDHMLRSYKVNLFIENLEEKKTVDPLIEKLRSRPPETTYSNKPIDELLFPFLFLGAGDATYYDFLDLKIYFNSINQTNFESIKNFLPKDLQLVTRKVKHTIHIRVGAKPLDPKLLINKKGFYKKLEKLLINIHKVAPIRLVVSKKGFERPVSYFSDWHRWSVAQFEANRKELQKIINSESQEQKDLTKWLLYTVGVYI